MEAFFVLLALYLIAAVVVLPIWTIIKITQQRRDQEILQQQLTFLEKEIQALRAELKSSPVAPAPAPAVAPAPQSVTPPPAPAPAVG